MRLRKAPLARLPKSYVVLLAARALAPLFGPVFSSCCEGTNKRGLGFMRAGGLSIPQKWARNGHGERPLSGARHLGGSTAESTPPRPMQYFPCTWFSAPSARRAPGGSSSPDREFFAVRSTTELLKPDAIFRAGPASPDRILKVINRSASTASFPVPRAARNRLPHRSSLKISFSEKPAPIAK